MGPAVNSATVALTGGAPQAVVPAAGEPRVGPGKCASIGALPAGVGGRR